MLDSRWMPMRWAPSRSRPLLHREAPLLEAGEILRRGHRLGDVALIERDELVEMLATQAAVSLPRTGLFLAVCQIAGGVRPS